MQYERDFRLRMEAITVTCRIKTMTKERDAMQKAFIVYFLTEKRNNLDELNRLLSEGWKLHSQKPMGTGESTGAYSLVILEK